MPFEGEMIQKLIELGSVAALSGLGMWLTYRVVKSFGVPFIKAQVEIAQSMACLAEAVKDAKTMVCEMVGADRSDHREIVLTLQVLSDEVRNMRKEIKNEG